MDKKSLQVGLSFETRFVVTEDQTAKRQGSGTRNVLSTPSLVVAFEQAAEQAILAYLDEQEQSVGISFQLTHDAPTPVGMSVWITVRLSAVHHRTLEFELEARDEIEQVAKGKHWRTVASKRLLDRHLAQKLGKS